ncbi:MAG TPA: AgmX/PglI C-terminal domain-containing protein [Polyangia bacterium]|jgi:outer membrane biosynthesis protein TonB
MAQLKNPDGAPKILRIGIIQNGKIVEERLVRKRESVTIGQSTRNTFVVPASNALPRTFTIFELTPAGYAINFSDMMDGRVSLGDQVVALPALRQGKAQKKGELWHLLLPDRSRGKVVIGDVTVLFQFVTPPPVQPRPQLPPSVRSSLMQNLDWMLVAVVAASFLAHFGFVIYLRNIDWPRKPDIEEIPDRFVQMIVPKKVEEPKPVLAQKEDEKKDEEKKDAKKDHGEKAKPKPVRDPEAEARAAAERRARLAADVQKMGVLKMLTAKGDNGAVADLVKGGDVSGDADKVFAQVGGVGVATSGGGLRGKGAGGTGTLRGGGSLRASGPGEVGTGERGGERVVHAVVKDSAPQDVDGSLDPSVIAKEIRSRLGAIKACYEAGLKRNPNIGGKVQLRFEVSSVGKVTSAEIENDTMKDEEVASCITSRVKTWRFPAPSGGSVQFSYPFIFQASK